MIDKKGYNADYLKTNYKQISLAGSASWIDGVKEYCSKRNIKVNTFIKGLIDAEMEKNPIEQYAIEHNEAGEQSAAGTGPDAGTDQPIQTRTEQCTMEQNKGSQEPTSALQQIKNELKQEIISTIIDALRNS